MSEYGLISDDFVIALCAHSATTNPIEDVGILKRQCWLLVASSGRICHGYQRIVSEKNRVFLLLLVHVKLKVTEEKREKKGKSQEDRIRQHATADSVFEYFANYKVISQSGLCDFQFHQLTFYM